MNTKGIQKLTQTIGGTITKNSPTILTGLSVTGLITTTIMAVKATPKALRILDHEHYERFEKDRETIADPRLMFENFTKREVIGLTWKCYIPAAIMGVATIGCIVGANKINLRRNAALAGAYSLTEKALKEYQAKVVEKIGENKAKEIKDDIARDRVSRKPLVEDEIILTGNGDDLCYEELSGRYFKSSKNQIESALNNVDRRLRSENYISLNEVYSELDLEGNGLGDLMGFYIGDGPIDPDFSSILSTNGKPCLVLDFKVEPRYYKRDY